MGDTPSTKQNEDSPDIPFLQWNNVPLGHNAIEEYKRDTMAMIIDKNKEYNLEQLASVNTYDWRKVHNWAT